MSTEIPVPDDKGVYTLEDLVLIEGYQTLNIVLQGHQQLKRGVYLYTAADGASASQTLVGIAEGPYQVNADLEWTLTFDEKTTYTDSETVFLNKIYDITNAGTSYPTETFTFDIEPVSVTDAAAGVTVANMPVPTVGDVTFWTEDGETTKQVKIDIPPYNSVGIYTYTIRENAGDTAGVTYYGTPIELKVTVIQDTNGKLRVAAIRTGYKDSADKSGDLVNVYSAGELSFTKTVTGNMGDQSKYFPITVTLTGDSGKKYSAINASETPYSKTITNEDGTTTTEKNPTTVAVGVSTTFYLKHGDTVHLTNIPYGVTYTVTEPEPGDYDMSIKGGDNDNGTGEVDSADEGTVTVINEKTETVDTGISVDSVPYIALLGAVTLGGGGYIISKKRRSDDDD